MPAWLTLHPPEGVAFARVVGDDEAMVIGRAPDCGIVLAHDSVSRHHARIVVGPYLIEVAAQDGKVVPTRYRERIRAFGPSTHPELAKPAYAS